MEEVDDMLVLSCYLGIVGDQEQGASTSLLHHIIAQLFPFDETLHCLHKPHGLSLRAKVKRLAIMRNEPLESRTTTARPHLHAVNHKWKGEIVKHAHKKSLLLLQKARNNGKGIVVADATD
jgi:hypothetical protein